MMHLNGDYERAIKTEVEYWSPMELPIAFPGTILGK